MIKKFLIIFLAILYSSNSLAVSLEDAILQAYKNNPELNAERENLKASKEDVNISRSEFLPTITLSGSKSEEKTEKLTDRSGANSAITDVNPKTRSITVEQKLFQGFGGVADLQKNKIGLNLAEVILIQKEQDILLKAVEAYTGLKLASEKVEINKRNVNLLERQVETDQIRLENGTITVADLAQSESSLAGANANLINAETELLASKINFKRVIRKEAPSSLNGNEKVEVELPSTLKDAIDIAKFNNSELLIAKLNYEIAEKDLNIEKARLSPSASIKYSRSENKDFSTSVDDADEETVKATITWPIIKGGENISSIKKSSLIKQKTFLLAKDAENKLITDTTNAWSKYKSSGSVLIATEAQLKAAEIANEGITLEYDTGNTRTTLEVIQSRSLLLESRIAFAKAERDFVISKFQLAFQLGTLSLSSINEL